MDTVTIRHEIQQAQTHESRTHELATLLHRRLNHTQLALEPERSLRLFVCNFVNRTPDLLDTLLDTTRGSPREDLCDTLAGVCLDFFLWPPPLLAGRSGLNGAMGKAYLCHRLIDEVNNCCILARNTPLLPFDLSCSNLVVHQLLGKPVASVLDDVVQNTTLRLRELAAFEVATTSRNDTGNRLLRLCQKHDLLNESLAPGWWIRSCLPSGSIH